MKFFEDMGVNPSSDNVTFLICSKMNCNQMGLITQPEWVNGFKALGVSTVDELKRKLP